MRGGQSLAEGAGVSGAPGEVPEKTHDCRRPGHEPVNLHVAAAAGAGRDLHRQHPADHASGRSCGVDPLGKAHEAGPRPLESTGDFKRVFGGPGGGDRL
jgi:hypothetical protein